MESRAVFFFCHSDYTIFLLLILFSYLCSIEDRRYRIPQNFPTQFHPSDVIEFGSDKKVWIIPTVDLTG